MKYKRFRETRKEIIILDELVEMTWASPVKNYYQKLGYKYTGWNDKFWCRVSDLPPNTRKKVLVQCPVCEKERKAHYLYILQVGHTVCGGCTNINDLTGMRFGSLSVIELDKNRDEEKGVRWICCCDCGVIKSIDAGSLVSGRTVSCGCFNLEKSSGEKSHFWNGGPAISICNYCGNEYEIRRSRASKSNFCSNECRWSWLSENRSGENSHAWKGGPVPITCDWCGKGYERAKSQLAENNFCSHECYGKWLSKNQVGEAHPRWDSSITDEERIVGRNYLEIRQWTQDVLEKDNYTCQICGSKDDLEAHHMYNYKHHPEYRLSVEFGLTMCRDDHQNFHSWMGGTKKKCVPADLDRWLYVTSLLPK